jgi:hypothetical protein
VRIGVTVLDPGGFEIPVLVAAAETELAGNPRFTVVDLPDSAGLTGGAGNLDIMPAIASLASGDMLDVVLMLAVSSDTVGGGPAIVVDSVTVYGTLEVTASGRFYTASGRLMGTLRETLRRPTSQGGAGDMAAGAVAAMTGRAMLELFPAEVTFEAGTGGRHVLPSGRADGLRPGMFLELVAVTPELPLELSDYDALRSHGLAQVTRCSESSCEVTLLSGSLAPGGAVTALEQGAPASVTAGWEAAPVDLEEGAEQEGFEDSRIVSRAVVGVSTMRWGWCFGGTLFAGTTESLSSFGIGFQAGPRIALSAPGLALRLGAGAEVDFLIQDSAADYLMTDATSVAFAGLATLAVEFLPSDRIGLAVGATGALGTEADSWTVQDETGQTRQAEEDEIYYASVAPSTFRLKAGLFYLIY